jgi:aquaglyceroporin related protein
MSYIVGYGSEVWSAGGYYFWVSSSLDADNFGAKRLEQIPMVAPFLGCTFGAFLYDVFIFTGPSPVNTPWMGLKQLQPWNVMRMRREHIRREKDEGIV